MGIIHFTVAEGHVSVKLSTVQVAVLHDLKKHGRFADVKAALVSAKALTLSPLELLWADRI